MAEAKRDENRKTVAMAASSDDPTVVLPLPIEPITGRLQVALVIDPSLPASLDPKGRRDGNFRPVAYGVTDDAAMDIVPISTDGDGNLLMDFG